MFRPGGEPRGHRALGADRPVHVRGARGRDRRQGPVHQSPKDAAFADVARDIGEYVLRDPEGGFFSAEDADSLIEAGGSRQAEGARQKLLDARRARPRPPRDDKVLAAIFGAFGARLARTPANLPQLAVAINFELSKPKQIVLGFQLSAASRG